MSNVNTAVISGNLTRDPEVRWLAEDGSTAIVNFGIAVNRRRKKDDEYIEEVSFFDIEVFGGFAVLAAKKLKKADAATIQGRLEQQTWGEGDSKKSKIVLVAEQIDSEAFFRSADENNTVAVASSGETPVAAAAPAEQTTDAAAPASDDIPF